MLSIAIDGPAGAGKSTVAKLLAAKLGAMYIDTGAMYRALTFKALKQDISVEDEEGLYDLLCQSNIQLVPTDEKQLVLLDGVDVTEEIRSPYVSQNVSSVAKHAKVRKRMVELQQKYAEEHSVVMDGRDIGTTVLPNANVKFFLTASLEERARRRYVELCNKGYAPNYHEILQDIQMRDKLDQERESSPLIQAEDAITIDATALTIDEVVAKLYEIVRQKTNS